MLEGVPAATALKSYPEQVRGGFYRELGAVARAIHGVRGRQFGPVAGPTYERWSDALFAWFDRAAADLTDHGLDASAVTELMRMADRNRQVLDEVREPRLLHGDLWVGNTMLAASSPVPSISGVFDCDRTWWGDPEADWPIYLALRKPGSERDAFWSSYGRVQQTEEARWRAKVYEAKHAAALLLEFHRFGRDEEVEKTNNEIRDLTATLRG